MPVVMQREMELKLMVVENTNERKNTQGK